MFSESLPIMFRLMAFRPYIFIASDTPAVCVRDVFVSPGAQGQSAQFLGLLLPPLLALRAAVSRRHVVARLCATGTVWVLHASRRVSGDEVF